MGAKEQRQSKARVGAAAGVARLELRPRDRNRLQKGTGVRARTPGQGRRRGLRGALYNSY